MRSLLSTIALRVALCAAVTYVVWRLLGTVALVLCAPLLGIALARPILEVLGGLGRVSKQAALAGIAGRHYQHRGIPIDIVEDERHRRWIDLRDVRHVVEGFPRDSVIRNDYPDACRPDAHSKSQRMRADALHAYLRKSTDPASLRFRNWLAKEVLFPAERVRERLGIREHDEES